MQIYDLNLIIILNDQKNHFFECLSAWIEKKYLKNI